MASTDMRTNALADVSLMTKDKTWIRSVSRFLRRQRSRLPLVRSMLQSSSRRNSNTLSSRSSSNRTPVAFSRSRQAVSIPVYDKCMSNENESYSYRISSSTDQTDNMCVSTPSQPPATLHICDTCKSSINWYFGSISRQVTEIILQSQPVGAFIVRNSSSRNGNFALSVRVVEDEYRPTGVAHYLLVKSAKNRVQIKGFKADFDCVLSLLIHYSRNAELLPCTLRLFRDGSPVDDGAVPYHEHLRLLAMAVLTRT